MGLSINKNHVEGHQKFSDFKRGDVFRYESTPEYFFIVIAPVTDINTIGCNAVCLNDGSVVKFTDTHKVKKLPTGTQFTVK